MLRPSAVLDRAVRVLSFEFHEVNTDISTAAVACVSFTAVSRFVTLQQHNLCVVDRPTPLRRNSFQHSSLKHELVLFMYSVHIVYMDTEYP